MPSPVVSVVVAAYHRADVLTHTLDAIAAQTMGDFECLVVGDACTDGATETVARDMASRDDRFGWLNLPVNTGEQSGPNNVGVARTTAPLVAFCNQDDLWMPDHLEIGAAMLDARAADLVFAPDLVLRFEESGGPRPRVIVDGLGRGGRFDPREVNGMHPASTWLAHRSLLERMGGFRPAAELVIEPSQDFLFRAHRSGARMRSTGVATVVVITSDTRSGTYTGGATPEHDWVVPRLGRPDLRALLLAREPRANAEAKDRSDATRVERWHRLIGGVARFGVSPRVIDWRLRHGRARGAFLSMLRERRGLDRHHGASDTVAGLHRAEVLRTCTTSIGSTITFGIEGDGHRHLASGWSIPESDGTWSDGPAAELCIRVNDDVPVWTELQVIANTVGGEAQRVVVSAVGTPAHTVEIIESGRFAVQVTGRSGQARVIRLELPDARQPDNGDPRRLGLFLTSIRLSFDEPTPSTV